MAARPSFYKTLIRISILLHVPLWFAVMLAAKPSLGLIRAAGLAAVIVALGFAPGPGRIRATMDDSPRPRFATHVVDQTYYVHWCACIFLVFPGLILWPILAWSLPAAWAAHAGVIAYLCGLAISAWGVFIRRRWLHVEHHDLAIAGLPKAFDGYRIAHVSDLHVGALSSLSLHARTERAIQEANVDVVLATGDYVTNGVAFHDAIADLLARFSSKDGTYASMGNHDYFGEGEPLLSKLRARGITVLRNESTTLTRGEQQIALAGIDDTWTRRADLEQTLAHIPAGMPTILLAHDPALFVESAKRGVALTLSGHTHGGQVAMPFLAKFISLSHLAHTFHQGIYRADGSTLYVHPGLGTTGPPVRLGVPPTVAIHTLRVR